VVFDLRVQYISREIEIWIIKRSGALRGQIQSACHMNAARSKSLELIETDVCRLQLAFVRLLPREISDIALQTSRCDGRTEMRAKQIAIALEVQRHRGDGFVVHGNLIQINRTLADNVVLRTIQ